MDGMALVCSWNFRYSNLDLGRLTVKPGQLLGTICGIFWVVREIYGVGKIEDQRDLLCTWENFARFWLWWEYDATYVDIVHSSMA
jgi:hypothetical protein